MRDRRRPSPGDDGTEEQPGRRKRARYLVAAAIVVALLVAAGVGVVSWSRRGPGHASVGGAVNRFRSSSDTSRSTGSLQPPPGVYVYEGSGDEHLSFLATQQSEAGALPGTVTTIANGCWTFAIEYNSFHRQTWKRCAVDGRLVERGGTVDQQFDFGVFTQSEHSEVICDPPTTLYDPAFTPGHVGRVRCQGTSQTTKTKMVQRGRITFVGRTSVVVEGKKVAALHYLQDFAITGGQTGSNREDVWLAASNGLPLREQRTIRVVSPAPAPINHVTYDEHGTWRITSLTPRT